MASTFKTFQSEDTTSTTTNLHEVIPITGSIISGSVYATGNIKNFPHGMFQAVYDYPYLSSSANHVMDITFGYSPNSALSSSTGDSQRAKKINIYNQFAKIHVVPGDNGVIQDFDQDGDISGGGTKMQECAFLSFSRLLVKDEIKKGSMQLTFVTGGTFPSPTGEVTIYDAGAATDYKVNSPAGEYGLLYTSSAGGDANTAVGHVYYQTGVVVLTASLFAANFGNTDDASYTAPQALVSSSIEVNAGGIRNRTINFQYNNTTELNSRIYFCRASSKEFNYSSNPTFLSGSKVAMKNVATDTPASYITTVGLYSSDNVLLAVAKLSEPLKKDPTNELTLRVRLDY